MLFSTVAVAHDWHPLRSPYASASSALESNWAKEGENYLPSHALDGDPLTAWVEGVDGYGEGELLGWATSPLTTVSAVKLRIRNGYQRSAELFTANGAVRDLAVRVTGGVEAARAVPVAASPFAGTRVTRRSEPWDADTWSRRWIGDASDVCVGTMLDLHRGEAGRIDQVDAWTTRRVADGDESVAPLDRAIENEHVVWVVR